MTRNGIGVVSISNPPVNAMSPGVPDDIYRQLAALLDDPGVSAVVLHGDGGVLAGADISALEKAWPASSRTMRDIFPLIEASSKPVIAYLESQALGGGLELAMACHFRVAHAGTALGQPEVTLGMPPGSGATQRLPRLVGFEAATEMITSGRPISGDRAFALGLVDGLVGKDDFDAVLAFAVKAAADGKLPLARNRDIVPPDPAFFATTRMSLSAKSRGQNAPLKSLECIEKAALLPVDEGVRYERRVFEECVASDEGRALRHLFRAERKARLVPGVNRDTATLPIASVAVIGSGTMGSGIAIAFADAGFPVRLLDTNPEALARAVRVIAANYDTALGKGRLTAAQAAERKALIEPVDDFAHIAGVDLVVEAVFEDMDVKKAVFAQLDRHCKADAILASNSSYLNLDEIADTVPQRREYVIGMHFFAPANIMKLLEIVRTKAASPTVLKTVVKIGARIGKKVVVAGGCHGFIANRTFALYIREAQFALEDGSSPAAIDKALTDFGMPMGVFSVRDLSGLEISWRIRNQFPQMRNPPGRYCTIDDRLCAIGRFGQRSGAGYYRYETGSPKPLHDPVVDELVERSASEAGIERRLISDEEIIERSFLIAVNEAAKILQEGIAQRASDIDLAWVHAYGFPARHGGLMHWADRMGLPTVLEKVRGFAHESIYWEPAELLVELAQSGRTFSDYDEGRESNA
ncbi:3-hydroxyacyl-CoA dehydrogenase NAD-binding domain-containing protein [Aliihoeflea sp. PC F10.4]